MDDLINRNAAIKLLEEWADGYSYLEVPVSSIAPKLNELPTIDSMVHCAECRYAEIFIVCGEPILTCDNNEGLFRDVPEDGYCYCGARMEET